MTPRRTKVIVVGAGFGGLYAARTLEGYSEIDVLLIDRNNYHTFTPLLYQVATCGLEAEEIAYPIRGIFRKRSNVRFLLGEVLSIDVVQRIVKVQTLDSIQANSYDYLIVATGSVSHFFGNEGISRHAFELKTLADALKLRSHILSMFERAAWLPDDALRYAYTTIVVVGGGPTGLETAGAIKELYSHVLDKEFNGMTPRVILVEAADRLLLAYPDKLQDSAQRQLESLGVEVVLNDPVEIAEEGRVILKSGRAIPTHTLVWSAGVKAAPTGALLGIETSKAGRINVTPSLSIVGLDGAYAVGDVAYLADEEGKAYPMLIPVAKQQGMLAARNIVRRLHAQSEEMFGYRDRGIMATIGRRRAVAWLYYRVQLTGFAAWVAWLGLHLIALLGFRNRLNVFINWVWNYFTFDRSVRIILPRFAARDKVDEAAEKTAI